MRFELPPSPVEGVYLSRGAPDDRSLRRASDAGQVRRLRPGAYVDEEVWSAANQRGRSLLTVQAVLAARGFRDVASHESAAVLLGLALLHEPSLVHVTDPRSRSTRTRSGLVIHAAPLAVPDVDSQPPFEVTRSARTVGDLVLHSPFVDGVAALDSALRSKAVSRADVAACVEGSPRRQGRATAERVLAFADPGAANPGESLSRVLIAQQGFAAPTLQETFSDADGLIGHVDFWWRGAGVIGEFDGFVKYSAPEYLAGRSPSEVVVDEKRRERRLESLPGVRRVVRWVWGDLMTPSRLFRELSVAGVPRV